VVANRPTLVTADLNGQDVLQFDGSNDHLASSVALNSFVAAGAFTIFSVWRATAISTNDANSYRNSPVYADEGGYIGLHLASSGPTLYGYVWDGAEKRTTQTISTGTWYLTIHYFNGTTISTLTKGIGTATASAGNITVLSNVLNIGKSYTTLQVYFNGKIAEVGCYNRQLTQAERDNIQAYITYRYGI
jgi:hypothetical protein